MPLFDPQLAENIGLSQQQKKELSKLAHKVAEMRHQQTQSSRKIGRSRRPSSRPSSWRLAYWATIPIAIRARTL